MLDSEYSEFFVFIGVYMKRIGVIGIVVGHDKTVVPMMQAIISEYSDIIVGRMGIPHQEYDIATVSLIVKGESERINALTGKLGRLPNLNVKSAMTSFELE